MKHWKIGFGLLIFAIQIILTGCGGPGSNGENMDMKVLVPVYFSPAEADDWNRLDDAANQNPGLIYAIVNEHDGPGTSLSATYKAAVDALRAHGGKTIGYVDTLFGSKGINDVKTEIDRWYAFYDVDGIFLDEQSRDTDMIAYYQEIYDYVKSSHPHALVAGNPGTVTRESYIDQNGKRCSDVFCIFERSISDFNGWTPESWCQNYDRANFSVLIEDADASSWRAAIDRAYSLGIGWVGFNSGDWESLPSYFSDYCAYLRQRNLTVKISEI